MAQPAENLANGSTAAETRKMDRLACLLSPERRAVVSQHCETITDLQGLSPAEIVLKHGAGLVLLEQGQPGYDQIVLSLAVERPSTRVIVLSDHMPVHVVRALMKLDASDILPENASVSEIIDAAERLQNSPETGGGDGNASAVCWAFRGAVGGAGVSTIAIESAFALARSVGPGKVCLIDLNTSDGMVSSFLDCVPKLDLEALSSAPERLDRTLLSAWCWEHPDGVKIIAAPRNPDADSLATESAILRLLDVACASFEYVLVDMPRHMMPWTKPILGAVDEAIIVSELTVPSLHAAADMCRDVDIWRGNQGKARLVLNRMFPKKRFRADFAVDRAERAIERDIDATVTSDWDAARTAVNIGKSIADVKPKSQLVADVATFVQSLKPGTEQAEASPKKRRQAG